MKRLLALLILAATPASADLYDYGMSYTSAAAAQADATMLAGHYNVTYGWAMDHVVAGLQCWRPSLDTTIANPEPPPANLTVTHPLPGYYVLVSIPSAAPLAALANDAALAFILDRTAREAGRPFVVKNNIGSVLSDLACSPMFASPNPYPIGGYQ